MENIKFFSAPESPKKTGTRRKTYTTRTKIVSDIILVGPVGKHFRALVSHVISDS
jgi:hypothetical protein